MLPRSQRINRASQFRYIRSKGQKLEAPSFLAFCVPQRLPGKPRLGVIVSAKIGSSVKRKRASRVLRAAFGQVSKSLVGRDIVLIARPYALKKSSRQVAAELERASRQIRT